MDALVLALASRPNDFAIPGLARRALSLYSASDAERVWAAVSEALTAAGAATGPGRQRRLATVVVGGGGATGVELAEMLPEVASGHGLARTDPSSCLSRPAAPSWPALRRSSSTRPPESFLTSGSRSASTRRSPPRPRRASGSTTASWWRAACSSGRAG